VKSQEHLHRFVNSQ
jgi:argininosuccinate lyase